MASNYKKGSDFERRVKKHLEAQGWYVIKSAGSRGLVDLASWRQGECWMMQCKIPGVDTRDRREQLAFLAKENNNWAFLVSRGDKHTNYRIEFEELKGVLR